MKKRTIKKKISAAINGRAKTEAEYFSLGRPTATACSLPSTNCRRP